MIIAEKLEEEYQEDKERRKFITYQTWLYDTCTFFDKIHQRRRDSTPRPIKGTGTYKSFTTNKNPNEKTKEIA
jgi:hypothetical protein